MSDGEESPVPQSGGGSGSGGGNGERRWYAPMDSAAAGEDSQPASPGSPAPASNIHTSNEYMELDEPEMLDEKKALLEEFERKRRARMIHVTTDDHEVKQQLRMLGEPICLFREGPADRRNRLKEILSRLGEDALKKSGVGQQERETTELDPQHPEETWYHEGPDSLKEARMFLVNYSISHARARLKKERLNYEVPEATRTAKRQEVQNRLRSFGLLGSQNADARPISYCNFSPNGKLLATSSWSGLVKVWQVPQCVEEHTLRGHDCYVDCVVWHPSATVSMEPSALNLVSSGRDGSVQLWSLNSEEPLGEFPSFESRVSRVSFHPSGRFLGACVHDNSWRLWDLEIQEEVLFQEGHSKPVYCIGFQGDGSLAATGGMDSYGRIWDLRTGRCVMFLSGHQNPVLAVDWSPDSYHIVTGSEDNTAKVWDVRYRRCIYTIPAHTGIVTGVRYDRTGGQYIVTCSYDGSVRLWCHGSFQAMRALEGHGQKVMAVDISPVDGTIATCSFDRTFKIWGPDKIMK
ncbi:U4/U6 small nuclear ribonucleoprotein Prp4 [Chionoecetes opilio]|uniref:U4/U6 small nuclear ribonucleoprotein Prp4 n=1 Tax=Chionoecetes opilio TaxID=41210 RepID=A0A8J4YNV1_CHIOP|nr:U4/U6 small nuclear ribonucleoprotein Prp4 [Chionoecetes opilio]